MKLHELKPAEGSRKTRTRKGRGMSSGLGKTSGRGHDGQKSRSGGGKGPYFEGGQTPLQRRLPKRGFSNVRFKTVYVGINLDMIVDRFEANAEVSPETLKAAGIVSQMKDGIKVLSRGELTKPLNFKVHAISEAARAKVEQAGGSVEVIK